MPADSFSGRISFMNNRKILTISIILVILGSASLILSICKAAAIILIALSVIGFAYCLKGPWYLGKASKIIRSGNREEYGKASEYSQKALKAGLSEEYTMAAASLLMQYGDPELAKQALETIIASESTESSLSAEVAMSQYYFIKGNTDKAIELADKAMEAGYQGKGLRLSMLDYLLRAGRMEEFRSFLDECQKEITDSPAIEDFKAVLSIAEGRMEEAGKILDSLLEKHQPSFSDPYVHYALVHIHYGERKKAIEELEQAESLQYTNMSVYPAPVITSIISILKGEYAESFMKAVSGNTTGMLSGLVPDFSRIPGNTEDTIPGFPKEPDFTSHGIPTGNKRSSEYGLCTDFTEDGEAWLKRHQSDLS